MTSYADEQMRQQYNYDHINDKKKKELTCHICNTTILEKYTYCPNCATRIKHK